MECLAIIPARGGSKGIPRKNVRLLAGKPLIAHNLIQLNQSHYVNRVVVSTDDAEIAATARQYGAEVVWRPAEISGDGASSESALLHALDHLQTAEGYQPDILAFLQCTSPLTLAEDVDGTIQALIYQQADSALAVIPFHYFLWRPDDVAGAAGVNHDRRYRPLRQEREPQYLETGAVYVMRAPGFRQARHRFFGKTALYVMPPERRLEIDDPVDFHIAEVLLQDQRREQQLKHLPARIAAVVFDFDGVFTNNKVVVFQDGGEAVVCDRSDGWGIGQLKKTGLAILVLSTECNPVVRARCEKLGIPYQQCVPDKGAALEAWIQAQGFDPAEVIYVGNDDNDLDCMDQVGCAVAVADAYPEARARADLVLEHPGGEGAVREICELILAKQPVSQPGTGCT